MTTKGLDKDLLAVLRDHTCVEDDPGDPEMCNCGWTGIEHARHLTKVLMAVGVKVKLPKINGTSVVLTAGNLTPVLKWANRLFDAALTEGTGGGFRPHLRDTMLVLDAEDGHRIAAKPGDQIIYVGGGRFKANRQYRETL